MDQELSLLRDTVCELADSPLLEDCASVWREMGLSVDAKQRRREDIKGQLTNLLKARVEEEVCSKQELLHSIETSRRELESLSRTLFLSVDQPSSELSLHQQEKQLRDLVKCLERTKHSHQRQLKHLAKIETDVCQTIGETPHLSSAITSKEIPFEKQLGEFRKRINELYETMHERLDRLVVMQNRAKQIYLELECEAAGELATVNTDTGIDAYVFNLENMAKLEESYKQLEDRVVEQQGKATKLRETIACLWDWLDITQEERNSFNKKTAGYSTCTIAKLVAEAERLNDMKTESLKKSVQVTRDELNRVWDCCFYGDKQRSEFTPVFSDNFTDDLLTAHERELERMKTFYRVNEDIYTMIRKRESLWETSEELEKKESNPKRLFNSRGRQLLKDQKLRQQVKRELPKIEEELKRVLERWEEDNGEYFIILNLRYLDVIARQWSERKEQKQQEKIKRQMEKGEAKTVHGSQPKPLKKILKRAAASPVASSAPINKMRKVSPSSAPVHSSCYIRQRLHSTKGKTARKRDDRTRKILLERNTPFSMQSTSGSNLTTDESYISSNKSFMASVSSSYTGFRFDLLPRFDSSRTVEES